MLLDFDDLRQCYRSNLVSKQDFSSIDLQHQMKAFRDAIDPIMKSEESYLESNEPTIYLQDIETDDFDQYDIDPKKELDDLYEKETYDKLIGIELTMEHGGEKKKGIVTKRKRDEHGNLIGNHSFDPLNDSSIYIVQFSNGDLAEYSTNIIVENLMSQVNDDGRTANIFQGIIGHVKTDEAIAEGWITTSSGQRRKRITTAGWHLLIEWQDGSTNWVPLSLVKQSNPVEAAQYAVLHHLENEPAFHWWVKETIKKATRWVSKIKTKYWQNNPQARY